MSEEKEYKKGSIVSEINHCNGIIACDNKLIERGKIFSTDTFIPVIIFVITYFISSIVFYLFNNLSIHFMYIVNAFKFTVIFTLVTVFIKWLVFNTQVSRSKASVKHFNNEIIKLNRELKELDNQ